MRVTLTLDVTDLIGVAQEERLQQLLAALAPYCREAPTVSIENADQLVHVQRDPLDKALALVGSAATTPDQIAAVLSAVAYLKETAKALDTAAREALLARCQEYGDIVVGTVRYYAGFDKDKPKAISNAAVLDALLAATSGDQEAVCNLFMAANPWKYGAIRDAVGVEKFNTLFQELETPALKEGKAKRLQSVDTKYLR